ncbi:MAG: fibronectin type III domain-containing protein [Chloroflexi bacterium]|nr:fibronectin type III domain-containing protein [Chloroflexota bacterium]
MEGEDFGQRLRQLRKTAGFNLRELAEIAGINFTYLSKIESGAMPPPSRKVILNLAEALNVDKDELILLAGKIPSDVAQILKNREAINMLRKSQMQKKTRSPRGVNVMKYLRRYNNLARVATAVVLTIAVTASLLLSAPLPVKAFNLSLAVPNSPITPADNGTPTYLLGENITIPASIIFAEEIASINKVELKITGPSEVPGVTPRIWELPLAQGTVTDLVGNLSGYILDSVTVSWTQVFLGGGGYSSGYVSAGAGGGTINYTAQWTPPLTVSVAQPPATPSGLSAEAVVTGGAITVSWTANTESDLAGYNLYRSTDDVSYTLAATVVAPATTYTVTGLTDGQLYYFQIAAFNSAGYESTISASVAEAPRDKTAPAMPTGLTVQPASTGNSLVVSWTANTESDLAGYNVYYSTDNISYLFETTISSGTTSYTDTGLTDGQIYYYKVSAIDGVPNESARTAAKSSVPGDTAAPATPTGLTVTVVAAGNSLVISWNANTASDLAGYNLWTSTDNTTFTLLDTLGKVTSYTHTALTNGTVRYYKLSAFDEVPNESARTAAKSGTPADTVLPGKPTNLAITVPATGSALRLSWTASTATDLAYYNLYFSSTGLPDSYTVKTTINAAVTTYTDNVSLTNGNKYYYKMSAVDDDGNESDLTALVSGTPADTSGPAIPNGPIATAGTANVTLTWTANAEADLAGYNVYRSTTFGGTYSKVNSSVITTNSYANTSLTNGTTYFYKITAVDTAGNESGKSVIVSATPTPIPTSAGERSMPPSSLSTLNQAYAVPTMSDAVAAAAGITKSQVSTTPLGLATDGTNLYILVDGLSGNNDVILVVDPATGVVSNAFYAASSNVTNAVAYHDGNLWVAKNPSAGSNSIVEVSKTDGSLTGRSTGVLKDKNIYALTSDGSYLYAGEYPNSETWWWGSDKNVWKVNPVAGTKTTLITKFGWGKGLSALAANSKGLIGYDQRGGSDGDLYLWAIEDGADIQSYYLNTSIEGMTFIGTTLFVATTGGNIKVSQPEKPEKPDWPWANAYTDRVDVNWNWWGWPANKIQGYNVYRSTTASAGPYYQIASLLSDKNYSDYTVSMNRDYWYKIKAVSIFGVESNFSDAVKATTPKLPAPNSFMVTGGVGQTTLTWDLPWGVDATQISGYNIYRKKGWAGTWGVTPINSAPVTVKTYTDSGLDGDTEYHYKVRAIDLNGNEGDETWDNWAWTIGMPSPVLETVQASYGSVYLSWRHDNADLIKSYKIYRRTGWIGSFTVIATGVTALNYTDTSVLASRDYTYKVSGVDYGDKETAQSWEWSVFTPKLGQPKNLFVNMTNKGFINLTWALPDGITANQLKGYNVYRASGNFPWPPMWPGDYVKIASLVTATSYLDTNPQSGDNWYRVVAVDLNDLESDPTPEFNWRIDPVQPPFNIWGEVGWQKEAKLHWDNSPSPNILGYNVYRSTVGPAGPWTKIANKVPIRDYTDFDAPGGNTWWVVTAVNVQGQESSYSPSLYLQLPAPPPPPPPPGPKVIPPQLAAGTYTARLTVYYGSGQTKTSSLSTFKLKAIDQVNVAITSMETASGNTTPITRETTPNFAATTPNIVVKGQVNDPSIHSVSLQVAVPWTEIFGDGMEDPNVTAAKWSHFRPPPDVIQGWEWVDWYPTDLWNRVNKQANPNVQTKTGNGAWYYGFPQQQNYETWDQSRTKQLANIGILKSTPITVGDGAKLSFWTWYETDPGIQFDVKMVLAMVQGEQEPRILGQISDFQPPPPGGFTGGPTPAPPGKASIVAPPFQSPGFDWLTWPVAVMPMKEWRQVELDLSPLAGKTVELMFFFNTGEASGNNYRGWYLDDISLSGKGVLGTSYPVTDMQFEIPFTLGEGDNTITVTASSPYKNYLTPQSKGVAQDSLTGVMDSVAPEVNLEPVPPSTRTAVYTVKGIINERNFDSLDLQVKYAGEDTYKTVLTLKSKPADGKFEKLLTLTEGQNLIRAVAYDKAGFTNAILDGEGNIVDVPSTAKRTIYLDSVAPTIQIKSTIYPTGEISARPLDRFILSINALDNFSVDNLEVWSDIQQSGNTIVKRYWERVIEWPEAVRDSFGLSPQANFVLFMELPSAPPGTFSLNVNVKDQAGNVNSTVVTAKVVSSLEAYNIFLMPNWNLVSLPLISKDADTNNYVPVSKVIADVPGIQSIWQFDAATQSWKFYYLGPEGKKPTPTLTKMRPGEGYWINMVPSQDQMVTVNGQKGYYVLDSSGNQTFVTQGYWMYSSVNATEQFENAPAFKYSAPLPGLSAQTPAPNKLTITGYLLKPGFTVPPSYPVSPGWNLIGFHSEKDKVVSVGLRSLTVPQALWASIIAYDNYIAFSEEGAKIYLGAFWSLSESDKLQPGKGYWLWTSQQGTIVP